MRHAITFDIDWAPDFAIALCAETCAAAGIRATFFATHPSPVLSELAADERFEVGIHPNFLPGSTQGKSTHDIINYCLEIVPFARSMRTHGLAQSSPLLAEIIDHTPQIKHDSSLYLHRHPGLQPVEWHSENGGRLVRLPYFWEDDVEAVNGDWNALHVASLIQEPGLQIFNFHPIHVALNMKDMGAYRAFKASLGNRPLPYATAMEVADYASRDIGTRDFLHSLLNTASDFGTITELAMSNPVCR